ncbi:MAG: hypothetical protein CM15mP49_25780 [Actinomycetota bacterium]|nr:MAG: hypothetical protein CM15mP49_25780 [Actinomycetota bacterium]
MTVFWWDTEAEGRDETDAVGIGMYQYADAGLRYLWENFQPSQLNSLMQQQQ